MAFLNPNAVTSRTSIQEDLPFNPNTLFKGQISDQCCTDAASKMKQVMVPVSEDVSETGFVEISFIHWPKKIIPGSDATLPLLLVHGFMSSSLEYRLLAPLLSEAGVDVYCVDLLGWGYTQLDSVKSFSASAKVEALKGFWQTVGLNQDVVVDGASLGGAAVIDFVAKTLNEFKSDDASNERGFVRGTILIAAQGFIDGIGLLSVLPESLARVPIKLLTTFPTLRNAITRKSFYNPDKYATEDEFKVSRLPCLRHGWEDSMLSFLQSGGFRPKEKVSSIHVPSLVVWGRQDNVLDGNAFAHRFIDVMDDAELKWIDECGHLPHLEQSVSTAKHLIDFLRSEKVRPV